MTNSGPNGEWLFSHPDWPGPLPVTGWQIWYSDASCVRSTDTTWKDAPPDGVQVIVAHHPGGRRTLCDAKDEYTMPGETATKLGEEIPLGTYMAIHHRAVLDKWRPA